MKPKQYITTPIYYVNDKPHIGHAYTSVACDVLSRFKRMDNVDVMFLTGTDEHGQKIEKAATIAQQEPQIFTDQISLNFKKLAVAMNCSFDQFIRTTETRHHQAAQAMWQQLNAAGDLYKGNYTGWYAISDEAYYHKDELSKKTDGTMVAPTGATVEWSEEPSWFFRLSKYQQPLLDFYKNNPDFIKPANRMNEVISFVQGGLQDLSVSRASFQWGIKIPDDEDHVIYVWLDALVNYLTALGYPNTEHETFTKFWPNTTHVVGKDIVRFHGVYWPAFLMSAGLTLPKQVFAHGWWMNHGQKMSKSIGNVIDPLALIDQYGLDQLRYFLMRQKSFGQDGDFTHEAMIERINSDLSNDLGNLSQRVLSMVQRYLNGKLIACNPNNETDQKMILHASNCLQEVRVHVNNLAFNRGLESIWSLISAANQYVDHEAPWALRKTDEKRMEQTLYILSDMLRKIALLVRPFMPTSGDLLLDQLCVDSAQRTYAHYDQWLDTETVLPVPTAIFPRIEKHTG